MVRVGPRRPVDPADVVEDQALERGHGHPHGPVLPGQQVAVHREGHPVGLGDLKGAQVAAQRLVVLGQVAAPFGGQGHHPVVDHLEDHAPRRVHGGQHALDRSGVAVVRGLLPVVAQAAGDAAAVLHVPPEVARRPGVDLNAVEVGDPPSTHGLLPVGIGLQGEDRPVGVVVEQGRAHVVAGGPADDGAVRDPDHHLDHRRLGAGEDHQSDPAVEWFPAGVGGELGPVGFVDGDGGEQGAVGDPAALGDRGHGPADLVCSQRVVRMGPPCGRLVHGTHLLRGCPPPGEPAGAGYPAGRARLRRRR